MMALEFRRVSKRFGAVEALRDLSLSVAEGETLALLGPAGAGKTAALDLAAGLEAADGGAVLIGGRAVDGEPPQARPVGMTVQGGGLYPAMTVAANIGFPLRLRGVGRAERTRAVAEIAAALGIGGALGRRPAQLSAVQAARAALARAAVRRPKLLLLDAPFAGLDGAQKAELRVDLRRLAQALGATVVLATRDPGEAMASGGRVAVLTDGALRQVGAAREIYERPASLVVARLAGAPGMNLFRARVAGEQGRPVFRVDLGPGGAATLRPSEGEAALAEYAGTDVTLGLWPEAIGEAAAGAAPGVPVVETTVEAVEPAGAFLHVVTRIGESAVTARLRGDAATRPGQRIRLAIDMGRAVAFDMATESRIG